MSDKGQVVDENLPYAGRTSLAVCLFPRANRASVFFHEPGAFCARGQVADVHPFGDGLRRLRLGRRSDVRDGPCAAEVSAKGSLESPG